MTRRNIELMLLLIASPIVIVLFAMINFAITRRIASSDARPKRKGR